MTMTFVNVHQENAFTFDLVGEYVNRMVVKVWGCLLVREWGGEEVKLVGRSVGGCHRMQTKLSFKEENFFSLHMACLVSQSP